jgi:hypothetical protein
MSSWERSRSIPWDRIPLPDTRPRGPGEAPPRSLDDAREQIFRQMRNEAAAKEEKQRLSVKSSVDSVNADKIAATTTATSTKVPYSHMELLRQAAFGGCIGSITGSVFGFMDGMRTAGESSVLQKASNMAKGKYLMQGTTRSATIFGVFFGGFHVLKYGLRVAIDPGEIAEIAVAAPIAMAALVARPNTRQALPYGAMLVFMDSVNLYMRKAS